MAEDSGNNWKQIAMKKILVIAFLSLVALMGLSCPAIDRINEQRKDVRAKLVSACDSIDVPSGVEQVDGQEVIKTDRGTLTRIFSIKEECPRIKNSMFDSLLRKGWFFTREESNYLYLNNSVVGISCNWPSENKLSVRCSVDPDGELRRILH